MSVIAVKIYRDKVSIAGDSIVCYGWTKRTDGNFNKLTQINGMIIGSVGYAQESSLFFHYAETHKPADATTKDILAFIVEFAKWKNDLIGNSSVSNSYILVYKGKVFSIESMFVYEVQNFEAIGAGRDFALAALDLGHTPKESVNVACKLCCVVAEPVIEFEQSR